MFAFTLCYKTSANGLVYNPGVSLRDTDTEIADRIREYGKTSYWVVLRARTDDESEALYDAGALLPDVVFSEMLGDADPTEMVAKIRAVE